LEAEYLKTLTALYVEDDAASRQEVSAFLRRKVGAVHTAKNGTEGLEAFQSQRPHLVITDIQMPSLDGLAMVQEIRTMAPTVPVIITTAFDNTDYLMRCIDLGIDRFVVKPMRLEQMESALQACARRLRAEEQLLQMEQLKVDALRLRQREGLAILMGGIAHDYNNLLQAILAAVDNARLHVEPRSEAARFLDLTQDCSEEAHTLSQRLLMLGMGTDRLSRTGPLGATLVEAIREIVDGTPVALQLELNGEESPVNHHPQHLRMVFRNLALNALEAMPKGGTLRVSAQVRVIEPKDGTCLAPGDYLWIRFHDSGHGIPPEILPRIFDPYFSTKNRGQQKGMGLGLALSEAIIRAHGGTISAESEEGDGAVFHIHLPIA